MNGRGLDFRMADHASAQRAVEAVWRIESARVIAGLVRIVPDVGLAEELAQDAFVAAIQQWPEAGIPDNPGAWLMAAARNRAVDLVRRDRRGHEILETIAREQEFRRVDGSEASVDARLDGVVDDDLLRLIFTTCHPALSREARAAITLRLLCGLNTDAIARAFLVPEPTIAQRIVRAKRTLAESDIPFEVPAGHELHTRLASVLEVIYLLFNEGYTATAGDDWMRPALCDEATRLGRILAGLMPGEAEVHGLVALMELQASRASARVDAEGNPILLMDQRRASWDQLLIRRGLESLARAEALSDQPGAYTLQAAIAACHARARIAEQTDWRRIAALYERLTIVTPSPIIELNRAVAVSMASGPQDGLRIVDSIVSEPALAGYHLLPSVRGDLLMKLGRLDDARREFERAASITKNARERALLLDRAKTCAAGG